MHLTLRKEHHCVIVTKGKKSGIVALSLILLYVIRKQNPRCLIKNKTCNNKIGSKYCKARANKALKPHEIHDHVSLV